MAGIFQFHERILSRFKTLGWKFSVLWSAWVEIYISGSFFSLAKGRERDRTRAFEQYLPWAILTTRAIHCHLHISQKPFRWINISIWSLHSHLCIFKHTSACFSLKPDPNHKYKPAMQCHGHPLGWCRASREIKTDIMVRRLTKYLARIISENLKGPYLLRYVITHIN